MRAAPLRLRRGEYVRTWFDTGALGPAILYGIVTAAGPRAFRVRWESGLENVIRQDATGGLERVTAAERVEVASSLERLRLEAEAPSAQAPRTARGGAHR